MNIRAWIVLLLFLIWGFISWNWYVCGIKGFCGDAPSPPKKEEAAAPVAPVTKTYGPLTYNYKGSNALTTDGWQAFSQETLSQGAEGQTLIISGPFYSNETAPVGFADMGLARASAVRDLLKGRLDDKRIELASHSLGQGPVAEERFAETRFQWVTRNENVQETAEGALIYFPYKSDKRISNPNITAYLDKLAKQMKEGDVSIQVIGHTDDVGGAPYNKLLGLERAQSIKNTLIDKGVTGSKVRVSSRGEESLIAANETDAGRQKNRRTEIIISK